MKRTGLLTILIAMASLASVGGQMAAQTVQTVTPAQPKVKEITPVARPVPFSLAGDVKQQPITFRTVDQMTRKDRDLVADAESSISERAGFIGLEFNGGKWSYEQVLCPALRITFCCASPATTGRATRAFFRHRFHAMGTAGFVLSQFASGAIRSSLLRRSTH